MVQSFPPSKAVITSLSPARMGDERPGGAGTFHLTFVSGPMLIGGLACSATPEPPGPRNCGHSNAFSPAVASTPNKPATTSNPIIRLIPHLNKRIRQFNASTRERHRYPPEIYSVSPVIQPASLDARNTTAGATSAG